MTLTRRPARQLVIGSMVSLVPGLHRPL